MTQESRLSGSRKPTERSSPDRSALTPRTVSSWSGPSFIVTTRNMAARVSDAATGWEIVDGTRGSMRICSADRHSALVRREEQILGAEFRARDRKHRRLAEPTATK